MERLEVRRGPRASRTGVFVALAVLLHLGLQAGHLIVSWPRLQGLRTAFWHDQLGYLAIVANVITGTGAGVEPVTETGVNHYPALYYTAVGWVGRVLDLTAVQAWNATALAGQALCIGALAWALARLGGRPHLALLAPLPFLLGTLSSYANGTWFTTLASHATLWGPYGVLYPLNGETAGLSVVVAVLSVVVTAWLRGLRRRRGVTVAGALALGVLSAFQTYSFLTGVYLACAAAAAFALLRWGRPAWWGATALAAVACYALGPTIGQAAGQLPTLVWGLLPVLPGLLLLLLRAGALVLVPAGALAAAALPQIVATLLATAQGDPFLTYRTASNVDLGVVSWDTLRASVPVLVLLVAVLVYALRRRDPVVGAIAGVPLFLLVHLSLNDLWGANAEPYRFWIELTTVGSVAAALAAALVAAGRLPGGSGRARRALLGVLAATLLATLPDYVAWNADPTVTTYWDSTSEREKAIREVALRSSGGLLLTTHCIDVRTTKVTTALPLADYYLGMAWPEDVDAVRTVVEQRWRNALTVDAMRAAGVTWYLADAACPMEVESSEAAEFTRVASRAYRSPDVELPGTPAVGEVVLYRLDD